MLWSDSGENWNNFLWEKGLLLENTHLNPIWSVLVLVKIENNCVYNIQGILLDNYIPQQSKNHAPYIVLQSYFSHSGTILWTDVKTNDKTFRRMIFSSLFSPCNVNVFTLYPVLGHWPNSTNMFWYLNFLLLLCFAHMWRTYIADIRRIWNVFDLIICAVGQKAVSMRKIWMSVTLMAQNFCFLYRYINALDVDSGNFTQSITRRVLRKPEDLRNVLKSHKNRTSNRK